MFHAYAMHHENEHLVQHYQMLVRSSLSYVAGEYGSHEWLPNSMQLSVLSPLQAVATFTNMV